MSEDSLVIDSVLVYLDSKIVSIVLADIKVDRNRMRCL
jgi:hypothetical protein